MVGITPGGHRVPLCNHWTHPRVSHPEDAGLNTRFPGLHRGTRCLPGVIRIIFHPCTPGWKIAQVWFDSPPPPEMPVGQGSPQMPAWFIAYMVICRRWHDDPGVMIRDDPCCNPWMSESPFKLKNGHLYKQTVTCVNTASIPQIKIWDDPCDLWMCESPLIAMNKIVV